VEGAGSGADHHHGGGGMNRRGGVNWSTFTFTFTDTNGANDLGVMNILVNDWLDGRHACYLAYARATTRCT